jgi:hypothetical protein
MKQKTFPSMSVGHSPMGMYTPSGDSPTEEFLIAVAERLERLADIGSLSPRDLRDMAHECRVAAGR